MSSAEAPRASRCRAWFPTLPHLLRALTWLPRKVFRLMRRHAITIGLIILGLVVVHGIAVAILAHQVESTLSALRARGEPIAARDLVPAKIPDRENGAVIFAKAFKMLDKLFLSERPVPPPAPAPVGEPGLPPELGGPQGPTPAGGPAIPGGPAGPGGTPSLTESKKADMVLNIITSPEERAKYPRIWSKAEAAKRRMGQVLALAQQAMARPRFQFPVRWQDAPVSLFQHLTRLRQIARYACASAMIEARKGNSEAATRYLELAFKMADVTAREPSFISQLFRYGLANLGCDALGQVIGFTDLTGQERARLDSALARLDLSRFHKRALQGDRAMILSSYREITGKWNPPIIQEYYGIDSAIRVPWYLPAIGTYPLRPLLYRDELSYLHVMNRVIRRSQVPYRLLGPKDRDPFDRPVAGVGGLSLMIPFAPISSAVLTLMPYPDLTARRDGAMASVAVCCVALAVLDYRERFGAYPNSLEQIQEKLARPLPEDPFTGKPLIYRRQGKGFLIYSFGRDLKDDHGRPSPTPRDPRVRGDIVLKRDR